MNDIDEQMAHNNRLQIDQLCKQYRAGKRIFHDITMVIEPGEGVLLTGANGSGKTTFLKLLSVNSFPSEGRVTWGGIDIHKEPTRYLNQIGLVHDEESMPNHISALELLEWVVRSRDQWSERSAADMNSLLDQLELDESREEEIGTYSTGMRKKTQIAAALITRPPLLILDEPLRGLDSSSTDRAMELFREAVTGGTTLLMATHADATEGTLFSRVLRFPLQSGKG